MLDMKLDIRDQVKKLQNNGIGRNDAAKLCTAEFMLEKVKECESIDDIKQVLIFLHAYTVRSPDPYIRGTRSAYYQPRIVGRRSRYEAYPQHSCCYRTSNRGIVYIKGATYA